MYHRRARDPHCRCIGSAGAGFSFPLLPAWVAGFFELALALVYLTRLFFGEAAMVSVAYVYSSHFPSMAPTGGAAR